MTQQAQRAQITATLVDHMGSDLSVVNAARVSFGKKSDFIYFCHQCIKQGNECGHNFEEGMLHRLDEKDEKLIKYLAKHKHISPFGHAFASFHVKAPIFVARQLVKHKFLRWNEISRRYVDDEPEFYMPDVWRGRSADKKQGSDGVVDSIDISGPDFGSDGEDYYEYDEAPPSEFAEYGIKDALHVYKTLLGGGVAPEQARMVLPQSTMTEFYWSGSLDAFADMCRLRCKEDTQYESRLVADQVSTIMQSLYPVSWSALMEGE